MNITEHIFREYDIRGVVKEELSNEFAYILGRAYATLAKDNNKDNISIGYDCRLTSRGYAENLAKGMSDEGVSSTIIGMGPTPLVYWSLYTFDFGGGIQITGSHNPSNMNGFKICLGNQTLSGEMIQDLKKRVFNLPEEISDTKGKIDEKELINEYAEYLISNSKPHQGKRKLKIVTDAGNGVGGMIGPKVLRGLGHEVIELYCEPDGTFPNHHPDPTELKNLKDLIAKVKETGADFGIGWDGDADRIGIVDEEGTPVFGDMILLTYAREIMKEIPTATVIGDVKCSSLLFDDINNKGGNAVMWKTGHSLVKSKLRELKADLAGEMSGHIFFGHRFFGFDCAIYCSCRYAEIMSKTDSNVSELLSDLPKMVNTPEIRLDCAEDIKFKVIELATNEFSDYEVDYTDGLRIQFDNGWGLMRASNTQPVIVLRFEATDEEKLSEYQTIVTSKLEELKSKAQG